MLELLDDGNYTAGTNGSAAFTDSEGKTLLHSYGMDQFDGHLYVITRHAHLCYLSPQIHRSGLRSDQG